MEKLSYKLETFEGPLDLLLYLITKNKLDICDIQISELLDQYMEQINAMQEADMDVSSEFLEMAARLVYMKTVSSFQSTRRWRRFVKNSPGSCWNTRSVKRLRRSSRNGFLTISMCGNRPKSSRISVTSGTTIRGNS